MKNNWHTLEIADVFEDIKSGEQGLSEVEATARLKEYGLNILPESKPDGLLAIFFRQFKSPLIYILLLAGVIVFFMREFVDALVILAVLVFNAIVGTIQEGKAQNILLALKNLLKQKPVFLEMAERLLSKTKMLLLEI